MAGRSVLVVAPHGLDEVLGCGGTMARHAAGGDRVCILILSGDGTGRDEARRAAAGKAAALLGAQAPEFCGLPENRLDTMALSEVVGRIEDAVRRHGPGTVYVSHGGNLNVDHQIAFRAAATAIRPAPGQPVAQFYAYEVPSSTDWAVDGIGAAFRPQRFVDIGGYLGRKKSALELYGDEMRPSPHARSIEAVLGLAARRGAEIGLQAAEAFMVLRELA